MPGCDSINLFLFLFSFFMFFFLRIRLSGVPIPVKAVGSPSFLACRKLAHHLQRLPVNMENKYCDNIQHVGDWSRFVYLHTCRTWATRQQIFALVSFGLFALVEKRCILFSPINSLRLPASRCPFFLSGKPYHVGDERG
ncbi:hypothetical protein LZ31DRAFT_376294 [Colletotrichum somersetense]|nr:hypothetical protein LZ31DRAFT_376294 [Colletotrichum somersetense]